MAHLIGLSNATNCNHSHVIKRNKEKHQMTYGFLSFKCQINQSVTGYLFSHMTWIISDMNPDFFSLPRSESRPYLV